MNRSSKLKILGFLIFFVALFSFVYISENVDKYIAERRLKKFNNLGVTIAHTKSTFNAGKSGSYIKYVYSVKGVLYGGSANLYEYSYKYPNYEYYVVYSKDIPTLQIILPEYSVTQKIDPDTLAREYLLKRLLDYARTETKDDWGDSWGRYYEYPPR